LLVVLPVGAILLVLHAGSGLPGVPAAGPGPGTTAGAVGAAAPAGPVRALPDLLVLMMQIAAILVACRVAGALFRAIGQPQVVGEMVAGIALGPSLLGWLWPGLSEALFAPGSLGPLYTLSQLGLLVFMFLVGLEFDPALVRRQGHAALLTSHVSISAPYLLGVLLALYLYPRLSPPGVAFQGFALFMGAAMSVTAFPVLARILRELKMQATALGTLAIACAAVDDVTAWCLLAYIVALVRASDGARPLWVLAGGLTVYLLVMATAVRRLLGFARRRFERVGHVGDDTLGLLLLALLASAVATEWLGIHLLFGAFFLGVVVPKDERFAAAVTARLEALTTVVLVPLFFAFTGLRTSIGLIGGEGMWLPLALVLLVAVAGKLGGSAIAARLSGVGWRDAFTLGTLLNTRGLMQLVILNVGLDLGILSPALFSMMVVMAVVTTFMTTPLMRWLGRPAPADRLVPELVQR
jgi:Kef-type K+ transport system membrane component KefB